MQPVTVMFSQGPYSAKPDVFFRAIVSSAASMSQFAIRTFRQWSRSMPSLLGTSQALRMLMPVDDHVLATDGVHRPTGGVAHRKIPEANLPAADQQ